MAWGEIAYQFGFNISILVTIASLFSQFRFIQEVIVQERRSWRMEAFLSILFGATIIFSVCTGIEFDGYSINTRMIGAMSSGLIGGPIVGFAASIIGAGFVLFTSEPQAFANAAAFSTLIFGLLGGGFYPYFQRGKWKYRDLFILACFAELAEMVVLLRMTISVEVLETIMSITVPVILLNSIGILLFISVFNGAFIMQDVESSRQLQLASLLSKKTMPLMREGLGRGENMKEMLAIILEVTAWSGIMLTNEKSIVEWQDKNLDYQQEERKSIPWIGREAMEKKQMVMVHHVPETSSWYEYLKEYSMAAVPFIVEDKAVGSLIVWVKKQWYFRQSELELLQNIVSIGSFQIAAAEVDRQKELRRKAEFKALQFQVNPHFLFNALNTISCVCRENPDRARELLVVLADFFRYNLNSEAFMVPLEEEMEHLKDYLELEKARFEDKLQITYDLPEEMEIKIPTLILQPIVENAVRHGKNANGQCFLHIKVTETEDAFEVKIKDKGMGFDKDVLRKLDDDEPMGRSVGLQNVHKRMKSVYGNGLKISSSPIGSSVTLVFKK